MGNIALIALLVLVGTIPFSGISQSFAQNQDIPEWVKTTLSLWSNGEISNEEFVTAIDYLTEKGIVKISSISEKENQRQIEYLKAKSDVFKEETKQLREENEEYRILLKSQELNKANHYPTSMSSIFDEYQALQKEVKKLKATNKKMSQNINDWISNFPTPEEAASPNVNNDKTFQARADQINELNSLKVENKKYKEKINKLEEETISYQNNIELLKLENHKQSKEITLMKIKLDESDELINSLNSKVLTYQGEIKTFKQKNLQYENTISSLKESNNQQISFGNAINKNDDLIKLNNENEKHQEIIDELKLENKILEKKASITTNQNEDNIILISEIESKNKEMLKQIELLHTEINSKHNQIETLKNAQSQKNTEISQIQAQKLQITSPANEDYSKQNDVLLVELNYLKAKGLVNDEEIETLRAENEEYRILLNLLKKEQDSTIGIDKVNYDTMNKDEGQDVVIYKTTQKQKELPSDWITKVDNSKEYTVYIENMPNWSKDMTPQVLESLQYWKNIADVEFKLTSVPSFETISIGWERELRNEYDGYVIGQRDVTVGLGSSDCDYSWKPYSSESIKNILIHELGHTLGLEHAISKTNIMYPMIHDAKFAAIDETISISHGSSAFIKGCSFSADPSYSYKVDVKDSKNVDIFFIPSIEEKYKVDSGREFNYYSNINCIGLDISSKSGICKVADSAGMLIINSDNNKEISLKVHLKEQ